MAKIIYGIQSDGLGHYSRSKAVINFLISKGHKVKILTSEKVYDFLKKDYDCEKIGRINFTYKNNRVDYPQTLFNIFLNFRNIYKEGFRKTKKIIKKFDPDLVITDFEIFSSLVANQKNIPLISIDNIHSITHTQAPEEVSKKYQIFSNEQKLGINLVIPRADYFFITSFFDAKVKDSRRVMIIPSLLRQSILDSKEIKQKDHILVYQTSKTNKKLFSALKKNNEQKFIIYGFDINKKDSNLTFKKYSQDGFITDFAQSKAVITNGGFSLISEAIFLQKPILSNPIKGQFEQILNATYVKKLGYGLFYDEISAQAVSELIKGIPKFKKNLSKNKQKDNSYSFDMIYRKIKQLSKSKFF